MKVLNDDCDSLSDFSTKNQKDNHILFNQSFHYEKEIIMEDFNTELENKNNLIAIENIFSNKKEKLEEKEEITYKNDIQRRNLPTDLIFQIIKAEFKNNIIKKKEEKE